MTEKSKRTCRVSETIHGAIAHVLQKEIADPRLKSVSLTGVDLSPDLKNAIIYFSTLKSDPKYVRGIEDAFAKAAGFFRVRLSQLVEMRHTPKLIFKFDIAIIGAERVSQLLDAV